MKNTWIWIVLFLLTVNFQLFAKEHSRAKKPDHLLFLLFDQMRPDYIEKFKLKNFKRLQAMGTNYKDAYVGHMASVTVVSHAVMTTGLLPSDLPWCENTFWDTEGKLGPVNQLYSTTGLKLEQITKLLSTIPEEQFLISRFKKTTGKKVFSIGEKEYSPVIMGGPYSDAIIYAKKENGQCKPGGLNVPAYIQKNDRYTLDCASHFGTENSFYPLDGNRFYPGTDTKHLGGDIWAADAAIDVMNNEPDWGALFITFGAIDKFGHMLGETDTETFHSYQPPLHLKDIAQIADEQLGRLLDELKKKNLLESTLIVSTSDHGGQTNDFYMGNPGNSENIFWIQRVAKMSPLRFNSNDTGLRFWLKEPTAENIQKSVNVLKEMQQVTEIFTIDRSAASPVYKSIYQNFNGQPAAFRKWANEHDAELANTCVNKNSADIVAALQDNAGFGRLGDHGGFQEKVQRIPMIVAGPGVKKEISSRKMRLVDLAPFISEKFNLPPAPKGASPK
jgi:hypothetical protein